MGTQNMTDKLASTVLIRVSEAIGISVDEIKSKNHNNRLVAARHIVVEELVNVGYKKKDAAKYIGRSHGEYCGRTWKAPAIYYELRSLIPTYREVG